MRPFFSRFGYMLRLKKLINFHCQFCSKDLEVWAPFVWYLKMFTKATPYLYAVITIFNWYCVLVADVWRLRFGYNCNTLSQQDIGWFSGSLDVFFAIKHFVLQSYSLFHVLYMGNTKDCFNMENTTRTCWKFLQLLQCCSRPLDSLPGLFHDFFITFSWLISLFIDYSLIFNSIEAFGLAKGCFFSNCLEYSAKTAEPYSMFISYCNWWQVEEMATYSELWFYSTLIQPRYCSFFSDHFLEFYTIFYTSFINNVLKCNFIQLKIYILPQVCTL